MNDFEVIPIWDMSEDEWLATRRRLGIGGSDAGTILGVNKYKSPYALWMDKLGLAEKDDAGEPAKWGHRLEPVIADAYAEDYNVAVVGWPVILVSKEHDFMFANVDYWEVDASEQFPAGKVTEWREMTPPAGVYGIVENKTSGIASPGTAHHWDNNQIPASYYWQGLHYSIVSGVQTVTFVALLAGRGLVTRDMPIVDEDVNTLIAAESMFWDMVKNQTPPPVDGSESTEEAQKQRFSNVEPGSVYDGGLQLQAAWDDFQAKKAAAEEADAFRKEARAVILEMIGNNEVGLADGEKLFTYKAGKPVESVDSTKLKAEYPEIWDAVKKVRPGSRVLRKSGS